MPAREGLSQRDGKPPVLDVVSTAVLRYQAAPNSAIRIDQSTPRWRIRPSLQHEEGRRTPQAGATEIGVLGAPAHFTLTISFS